MGNYKHFWRNHWIGIVGTGVIFAVVESIRRIHILSLPVILGAFMAGLIIGLFYNLIFP